MTAAVVAVVAVTKAAAEMAVEAAMNVVAMIAAVFTVTVIKPPQQQHETHHTPYKGSAVVPSRALTPEKVQTNHSTNERNKGAPQLMPKATAYRSTVITSPKLCRKWLKLSSSP